MPDVADNHGQAALSPPPSQALRINIDVLRSYLGEMALQQIALQGALAEAQNAEGIARRAMEALAEQTAQQTVPVG